MSTLSTNRRIVVIAFLIGFLATAFSRAALADAAADYISKSCVTCHGAAPGNIKLNLFPTNADLATYTAANMPKGSVGACTGSCAQQMADYLRPPSPVVSNQPPVANASIPEPTVGAVPLNVSFYAGRSTDDAGIVSYAWNFGDGTTGSGLRVQHTYSTAGTYTVTLSVADAQGLTNSTTVKIYAVTVHTPPAINTSRSSSLSGVSPLTVNLDASLSTCTGGCKSYVWQFNDTTTASSGATVTKTYNAVGTYKVDLTVWDGGAASDPATRAKTTLTMTVTASRNSPVANATKSLNLIGAAPLTAQFDASLSNCANSCSSYAWNFGDGSSAAVTDPKTTHAYQNAGNYTATLTVTDKSNAKRSTTTVAVKVVPSESLTSYVKACQAQLNFQNINLPDLNCYDGDLFATPADFNKNASVNDFFGYKKITDQVDLTFACRWLFGNKVDDPKAPISIEMLLHNRQNGNTCFLSAKGFVSGDPFLTSAAIVSPTGANASTFWDSPASVDAKVRCIGCHISGPYIATPTIAPFLAKYGLLNDGHDTLSNVSIADLSTPNKNVKYHAVSATVNGAPGAFSQWDALKQTYIHPSDSSCSIGCHMVGTASPQGDIGQRQQGFATILTSPINELKEINEANAMRPYDDWSAYRWINLDTAGDGVEIETFATANTATTTSVPKLFSSDTPNCAQPKVPNVLEAHVVGSSNTFIVAQPSRFAFLPDRLSVFNLKQGLVCLNSDQDPGQMCQDYRTRYECTDATGNKTWTNYSNRALTPDGDHEERSAGVCPAGSTATGIEAAITPVNGWSYSSIGPNDRLASFSQYGLTCNNADQPDGQCSNYVVRYSSCAAPPATYTRTLTNVFAVGKLLTAASGSLAKGQARNNSWNTQQWAIEPVTNTEYVRLRNPGTNVYLNVASITESATVGTAASNTSTNQLWLIEPVSGSTDVRLKNVFSGKYLTMADPASFPSTPDYLSVFSQTRNTGWTSQRWQMQ